MQKNKIKSLFLDNWCILAVLIISLILHILALKELGFNYSLNSDDADYIKSGIVFLQTDKITMHDVLSAQIMPGMTFLIAIMALIFGVGSKLIISLKILWLVMGLLTIYIVYKTIKLYSNQYIAAISCLFFLAADYIWMDNLILTETPYILLFSLLIYHTLKLSMKANKKDFILIVIYYILAGLLIDYLHEKKAEVSVFDDREEDKISKDILEKLKKYNFKLLIRQCIIAGIILLLCLIPWTYRNYKIFNHFIPLTYGTGNPLLLGTYQGSGYPTDEELDYVKNVDEKMPAEMKYYLQNPNKKDYMTKYYSLEYDGLKAKYRMHEWWNKDKVSMLKSYLIYKPLQNFDNYFYWDTIMGISGNQLNVVRKVEIILFVISSILIFINKKRIKEWLFLILTYGSQIAIYSYTFAFSRYAISMFFIRYIIIGIGILSFCEIYKSRRGKRNESVNDNSSI